MSASIKKLSGKVGKLKKLYNFQDDWADHHYESAAEQNAIKRLLKRRHFKDALDIGGGYGRLSNLLTKFCDNVILVERNEPQLKIAAIYLKNRPQVKLRAWKTSELKVNKNSIDLVLAVKVLHKLFNPLPEFKEIARVLKPGGIFLLEFANDAHFLNQLRYAVSGKKAPAIQKINLKNKPKELFIHDPKTVIKTLDDVGFELEAVLSGSNLTSPLLKKVLGKNISIYLEKVMQPLLAPIYFGPSVWLRLKKR